MHLISRQGTFTSTDERKEKWIVRFVSIFWLDYYVWLCSNRGKDFNCCCCSVNARDSCRYI